jgi:predicted ATPase
MTKKYVLTGGASCGKTSLIIHLEILGEVTVREVATDFIMYKQSLGIKRPWEEKAFQDDMLRLQLQREALIDRSVSRVFLDRGILDNLPYFEIANQPVDGLMKTLIEQGNVRGLYEKVFIIEHSGILEPSPVRRESLEQALYLEKRQETFYKSYGYKTLRVPFENIEKRIEFILSNL